MEKTVKVTCLNNGQDYDIPMGSNLSEALQLMNLTMEHEPILAHVNNKVEGMHYRIYKPKRVEFLDIILKFIVISKKVNYFLLFF